MEKEFVPYTESLELKQLGFNEPNYLKKWYDSRGNIRDGEGFGELVAPLYQQAFRWFREKYQLYSWTKYEFEHDKITPTYYIISPDRADIPGGPFNTYEDAELECIKKLIEIVKNK